MIPLADITITDAHHHLWSLSEGNYPWLSQGGVVRVAGDYSTIRKDYLLADFRRDIGPLHVTRSVHIEAGYERSECLRETAWLQALADRPESNGFPHAIVAYCDLAREDAASVLDRHRQSPNLRGIRQMLHEPMLDAARTAAPLYTNPVWRTNLGLLARHALSFELQVFPEQMGDARELVAANPDLAFVLCHTGMPAKQDPDGLACWRSGMRGFAALPNICVKISGLGMFDRNWTVARIRPLVLDTIEIFGPERCMLASNFPVDGMMSSYQRLWQAYDEITRDFSDTERRALFAATANRFYRI